MRVRAQRSRVALVAGESGVDPSEVGLGAQLGDGALLDSTDPAFPSLRASPDDVARVKRFAAQNLPAPALPAEEPARPAAAAKPRDPLAAIAALSDEEKIALFS